MTKFEKLISDNSNSTLVRRAASLATQAKIAQETVVNTLKGTIANLEIKISSLTDLAPETTDSLRPGSANWNPTSWATDLQRYRWDLWQAKQQLTIATETYHEFFSEVDAPSSKKD